MVFLNQKLLKLSSLGFAADLLNQNAVRQWREGGGEGGGRGLGVRNQYLTEALQMSLKTSWIWTYSSSSMFFLFLKSPEVELVS